MKVLGIETSCDDTSVSIIKKNQDKTEVLSHLKFSQDFALKKWGGVVPEIAARNHLEKITPLLEECFQQSRMKPEEIDLISVTTVPGLLGPLLTGLNAAKTLALIHQKPIVATNHLYAHLEAIHLTEEVSYPYLGLLVSGGHSIFFEVKSSKEFKVIGSTIDDAAGEAFDKGGKLMGLGYPAGHIIDRLAHWGDENKFQFPIGLKGDPSPKMSFSGVKTSLRMFVEKHKEELKIPENLDQKQVGYEFLYDTCASYQKCIVDSLTLKLKRAQEVIEKDLPIVVGGGVACNSGLRAALTPMGAKFVKPEFCTDNGAMIANYGMINADLAIAYPQNMNLDARGRFIQKDTGVVIDG